MNRNNHSISEAKIQASQLLKDLRSNDGPRRRAAASRLQRLQPFKKLSIDELVKCRDRVQRKHALEAVAREHGFLTWKKFKDVVDATWPPIGGFMHNWCKTYDEAKSIQRERGGYLLPYGDQYFLCEADYIAHLGLDPNDARWVDSDFDAARPADVQARDELEAQVRAVRRARQNALKD